MTDKLRALEMLMKHFMLMVERKADDSEDWDKWAARLAAARNPQSTVAPS